MFYVTLTAGLLGLLLGLCFKVPVLLAGSLLAAIGNLVLQSHLGASVRQLIVSTVVLVVVLQVAYLVGSAVAPILQRVIFRAQR